MSVGELQLLGWAAAMACGALGGSGEEANGKGAKWDRGGTQRLKKASAGMLVCWASSSAIGAAGRWLQQVAVQSAVSSEVAGLNGAAGEAAAMGRDGGQACS